MPSNILFNADKRNVITCLFVFNLSRFINVFRVLFHRLQVGWKKRQSVVVSLPNNQRASVSRCRMPHTMKHSQCVC